MKCTIVFTFNSAIFCRNSAMVSQVFEIQIRSQMCSTFAYMHGGLHQGATNFGARLVLGLVLAGIYLSRGSLLPAMFLHFLIDAAFARQ